jgi:putative ABC transport system permease protein
VVTEETAKRFFGDADPIGKTLRLDGTYNFEVTGVAANPPSNTDLRYELIASMVSTANMPNLGEMEKDASVNAGGFRTWFRLRDAGAKGHVEQTIARLAPAQADKKAKDEFSLTGLTEYHLHRNFGDSSNTHYLSVFPVVAGLILLLALVNYMSLATARSISRAKEVGVRKVLGAGRGRLAGQFYLESALFAILSFVAGGLLFVIARRFFFGMLHMEIDSAFLFTPGMLACAAGLLVAVVLVAGSYPSFVLSAFRPVAVLYGKLTRGRGGERVRKGFIVLQFTISMVLVLCSLLIAKELHYIRHTQTGLDRENVVMVPFGAGMDHFSAFKREVEAIPGVRDAATSEYPLYSGADGWAVTVPASNKTTNVGGIQVDDHYIPMLGLRWSRRPLREDDIAKNGSVVLNESAVEKLGLTGDPLGQFLKVGGDQMTVAGVLTNFNYAALRSAIGPMMFFVGKDTASHWGRGALLVKIGGNVNVPGVMERIRQTYKQFNPSSVFEFHFADEAFDAQYKAEDRLAGLMGIFTGITIVIACMGLFALATFAAQQRVKEIGIRKVLGASVASISGLLSRDFLRPVLLAVVIACPVAWWVMSKWLQDFAYRTAVSWWVFAISGAGLLGLALGTVLFRSLRAARANPVENLRVQ